MMSRKLFKCLKRCNYTLTVPKNVIEAVIGIKFPLAIY